MTGFRRILAWIQVEADALNGSHCPAGAQEKRIMRWVHAGASALDAGHASVPANTVASTAVLPQLGLKQLGTSVCGYSP